MISILRRISRRVNAQLEGKKRMARALAGD
jgi:hypothetical protein